MVSTARSGDTVRFHYTGRFADGVDFDASPDGQPMEVRLGQGEIIEGLDEALIGMAPGDTAIVSVPPEKAYGPHHAEAVQQVPRDAMPADMPLEPGLRLQAERPDGATIGLTVVEVGQDVVTLDANHPLAGKDLVFEIELVEVV